MISRLYVIKNKAKSSTYYFNLKISNEIHIHYHLYSHKNNLTPVKWSQVAHAKCLFLLLILSFFNLKTIFKLKKNNIRVKLYIYSKTLTQKPHNFYSNTHINLYRLTNTDSDLRIRL